MQKSPWLERKTLAIAGEDAELWWADDDVELDADEDVEQTNDAYDNHNEPTIAQHEPMAIATLIAKINW